MIGNIDFEGSLFNEFRRLQDQMDELFGDWAWPADIRALPRGSFPAVNIGASPEKVEVFLFAPGLDPSKLDVSLHQSMLTIAGERKVVADEKTKYYRQERFSGEFRRSVMLPEDVDPDSVDARYRNGILQVSIRRREASRPRQITVQ